MSDVAALQRKPARLPDDTVYPRPIEPGQSVEDWIRRRDAILRRWTDILGGFPGTCDLAPEILSELEQPTHLRRKVRYRVETIGGGIWVEAFLLVPKAGHSAGPTSRQAERQYSAGYDRAACPAVVVFHPTTHDTIGEPVGLAGFPARHSALHLVERGYVVLVPRNFLWDYRGRSLAVDGAEAVAQAMLAEHPGWTGMAKMVWDGMRAVDYLQTLECVDHDRIGCFGFSLGGKEALYLPALDPRVKAAVSIDGGIGLRYSNWDALWYLGPQIRAAGFDRDNHEVLSLVAPRAFLLIGSTGGVREEDGRQADGADGERSWPFVEAVLAVYRTLDAADRIGTISHSFGHGIPAVAREAAYAWLDEFVR